MRRRWSDSTSLFDATGRLLEDIPPSLPEYVRRQLEREIIERRLSPGERITEKELARRIGVSRTPVREAFALLELQGLIDRVRRQGTQVAPATPPREAEVLYELRAPLEGFLTGAAAESLTDEDVATLRRLQQEFKRELRRELAKGERISYGRLAMLDSDFHWTIYNAAGSGLTSIVASYWARLLREHYARVYESEHPRRFSEQHDAIIEKLAAHDAPAAAAAMTAHIETALAAIRTGYSAHDAG
jgi:DNA-binding GntR family transcriptional regulator